jgi:hypothetical protein
MFEVSRLWDILDFDNKLDIKLLYKRPRIDYRISEYIVDYINKTILEPNKIMQTGNYDICLSFAFYQAEYHRFHEYNIFDTENTKYSLHLSNRTENGIKYKDIWIGCYSTDLTEDIKPKSYASIVYDMIGVFLTNKYKKITKEIMDNNRNGIDNNYIKNFKFPAFFENQKYLFDDTASSYSNGEILVKLDIKEEYKKYYKE